LRDCGDQHIPQGTSGPVPWHDSESPALMDYR
jgi:hypothetical protein